MKTLDQRIDEAANRMADAEERHNLAAWEQAHTRWAGLMDQLGLLAWHNRFGTGDNRFG